MCFFFLYDKSNLIPIEVCKRVALDLATYYKMKARSMCYVAETTMLLTEVPRLSCLYIDFSAEVLMHYPVSPLAAAALDASGL